MKTILKLSFVTCLFVFVCGASYGQELNNPNKLPPCRGTDIAKWTNCYGSESVPNGYNYTGDYLNGKRHGYGVMDVTFRKNRGDRYVGEFKSDKYHGQGTYFYVANNTNKGDKYVGEYKEGNKHGQGTYTWANGDKYVGESKDSMQNGLGTYYHLAEDQWKGWTYFGYFLNGLRHGQSIYTRPDGTRIEGIYETAISSVKLKSTYRI